MLLMKIISRRQFITTAAQAGLAAGMLGSIPILGDGEPIREVV